MTWCPSTLQEKAERHLPREREAAPVADLGDVSTLTRGPGQLPPRVRAWPLRRLYLDLTEQPASASPAPEDAQAALELECDLELRHRGLRAAAHLVKD